MKEEKTRKVELPTNDQCERKARKLANRLYSVRNELEAGRIGNFEQIFAIISLTQMSEQLGMSFYTFLKKVQDPKQWTVGEIIRFSCLLGTNYSTVQNFLLTVLREKYPDSEFL